MGLGRGLGGGFGGGGQSERKTDGRVTVPNTKVSGVISDKRGTLSLAAKLTVNR